MKAKVWIASMVILVTLTIMGVLYRKEKSDVIIGANCATLTAWQVAKQKEVKLYEEWSQAVREERTRQNDLANSSCK